jgi:hypothetical protein
MRGRKAKIRQVTARQTWVRVWHGDRRGRPRRVEGVAIKAVGSTEASGCVECKGESLGSERLVLKAKVRGAEPAMRMLWLLRIGLVTRKGNIRAVGRRLVDRFCDRGSAASLATSTSGTNASGIVVAGVQTTVAVERISADNEDWCICRRKWVGKKNYSLARKTLLANVTSVGTVKGVFDERDVNTESVTPRNK